MWGAGFIIVRRYYITLKIKKLKIMVYGLAGLLFAAIMDMGVFLCFCIGRPTPPIKGKIKKWRANLLS